MIQPRQEANAGEGARPLRPLDRAATISIGQETWVCDPPVGFFKSDQLLESCPGEVLAAFAALGGPPRWAALAHPDCPTGLLFEAVLSGDEADAIAVASNVACPVDLLALLASSKWPAVRGQVAGNQSLPRSIREDLENDHEPLVIFQLSRNPEHRMNS